MYLYDGLYLLFLEAGAREDGQTHINVNLEEASDRSAVAGGEARRPDIAKTIRLDL